MSYEELYPVPHPCTPSDPLAQPLPFPLENTFAEMSLTRATKFGFMIESLVMASRTSDPLTCPAHPQFPLSIRDLAPDVVCVL